MNATVLVCISRAATNGVVAGCQVISNPTTQHRVPLCIRSQLSNRFLQQQPGMQSRRAMQSIRCGCNLCCCIRTSHQLVFSFLFSCTTALKTQQQCKFSTPSHGRQERDCASCLTAPCMQVVQAVQGCQLQTGLTSWQAQAASAWLPQAESVPEPSLERSKPAAGHAWLQAAVALAAANGLPGSMQACSAGAVCLVCWLVQVSMACAAHPGNLKPLFGDDTCKHPDRKQLLCTHSLQLLPKSERGPTGAPTTRSLLAPHWPPQQQWRRAAYAAMSYPPCRVEDFVVGRIPAGLVACQCACVSTQLHQPHPDACIFSCPGTAAAVCRLEAAPCCWKTLSLVTSH